MCFDVHAIEQPTPSALMQGLGCAVGADAFMCCYVQPLYDCLPLQPCCSVLPCAFVAVVMHVSLLHHIAFHTKRHKVILSLHCAVQTCNILRLCTKA
jgi:hypothetical protein